MVPARVRLGELLVEAQIITRGQLDDALALQKRDGRRIGTLLVEAGLVSETQVTQILSQQLSVPWVSLYHIEFSRQLLNLVTQELAERYCLVPIFVRRVRGLGQTLYVAMDDPSDAQAQNEVSQFSGLPVRAMIAPPTDIRSAIRAYYGAGQDAASLSEAMADAAAANAAAARDLLAEAVSATTAGATPAASAVTGTPAVLPPPDADAPSLPPVETEPLEGPDSGPSIEVAEIPLPKRKSKRPRMVTLTLLDGTKVKLPAKSSPVQAQPRLPSDPPVREVPAEGQLTARDLVAALRASSHGADATEILGENVRWESLFSALLSLMLKKHLIADWEFVEEYKKS